MVSLLAIVLSLTSVLLQSSVAQASESAETGVDIARDKDGDGVPEEKSAAAALNAAQTQNQPVEDLSQRTESASVVANPEGTYTLKDFGNPVRVERDNKWVDIDYTLKKQADGSWAPRASNLDVSVDSGDAKEAARVTFGNGKGLPRVRLTSDL